MEKGDLNLRVLVVDDEVDVRTTVALLLRHLGFATEVAASAAEAIELIQQMPFDMIFTDILLPGGTGEVIYEFVQEHNPKISMAFMSGSVPIDIEERLHLRAGENFLRKPFTLAELKSLFARYFPNHSFRPAPNNRSAS